MESFILQGIFKLFFVEEPKNIQLTHLLRDYHGKDLIVQNNMCITEVFLASRSKDCPLLSLGQKTERTGSEEEEELKIQGLGKVNKQSSSRDLYGKNSWRISLGH